MNDPRLTLMRDGVAALSLQGLVEAAEHRETTAMRCAASSAAIRSAPDAMARQDDQLLFGEGFDVLFEAGAFAFGQARRDGYVGYVDRSMLEPGLIAPSHWVSALRTYALSEPDFKAPPVLTLSMNSLVAEEAREAGFVKITGSGWVFGGHLSPIGAYADDFVEMAERYLAAPYLWGGRESEGLDCSGVVQQALYACGMACPRDSDMQAATLGTAIGGDVLARGDLVFWKGHVGIMLDETRLLHATAHRMATVIEPLAARVERAGPPTLFKRLNPSP